MTRALLNDPRGVVVGDAMRQGNVTRAVWAATTTNATPAEVFLDGGATADSRFIVPTDTLIVAEGLFTAWNETDSAVHASGRFALSVSNIAGTVAASGTTLEWDAASTDANPFSQYFVGSAIAGLVFTYNNTTKSITLTGTGVASKTIRWRAEICNYTALAL